MTKKAGVVWIDAQGERTLNVITTQSGVGGIEAQLSALSNASVVECWEGLDEVYTVSPVVAQYPTVRITAVLLFASASGSVGRLYLPAPIPTIFLSDGITIDPTQITALISAAVGSLICGDGTVAATFSGGQAVRTRFSGLGTLP